MSIHSSLSSSAKASKTRSVLKRAERLKILMDKELWKEGQSIFGLPKIKILKIKIKKEKAAPAAAEAEAKPETAETPEAKETTKESKKESKKETKAASATEKPTKPSSR